MSFAPKNMAAMKRSSVDNKRGAVASVDVESRRQIVANTLQSLHQREARVQQAEECVSAAYIFFLNVSQARLPTLTSFISCGLT
jgi:hypothetical protein